MRDLSEFFSQIHHMMESLDEGVRLGGSDLAAWRPLLDIYEGDKSIVIVIELPGIDKEHISVTVENGMLRVTGHRPKRMPDSTRHVHQMEIPYGSFARYVRLPRSANLDRIQAEYEGGFLTIHVPRSDSDE
jgi:HSP20 family protein